MVDDAVLQGNGVRVSIVQGADDVGILAARRLVAVVVGQKTASIGSQGVAIAQPIDLKFLIISPIIRVLSMCEGTTKEMTAIRQDLSVLDTHVHFGIGIAVVEINVVGGGGGFRQMGITQGVLCNLLFFTPATLLCGMSILYVQRQGRVSRKEWLGVSVPCVVAAIILIGTVVLDGIPLRGESTALRTAEYIASVLYVLMQSGIFTMQYKAYKQLELAVDEYYDRERRDLFGWMGLSMKTMTLLAFIVPLVIFMQGAPLVIFSIGFFFSISYSTISLYTYGVSKDVEQVEEAEMNEELRMKNEEWRTESGERRTES